MNDGRDPPGRLIWVGKRDIDVEDCARRFSIALTIDGLANGLLPSPDMRLRQVELSAGLRGGHSAGTMYVRSLRDFVLGDGDLVYYDDIWGHALSKSLECPGLAGGLNPETVLGILADKVAFRRHAEGLFPLLDGVIFRKADAGYTAAKRCFPNASQFVVHGAAGSACANLRLITDPGMDGLVREISGEEVIVTPLLENAIPLNVHIVVGRNETSVAPPSIQLITRGPMGRLTYRGCDFTAGNSVEYKVHTVIRELAMDLGAWLRKLGYAGVAGIDMLWDEGALKLVEINGRFQASTALLNRALLAFHLPTIQELQVVARRDEALPDLRHVTGQDSLLIVHTNPGPGGDGIQPSRRECTGQGDGRVWLTVTGSVTIGPYRAFSEVTTEPSTKRGRGDGISNRDPRV